MSHKAQLSLRNNQTLIIDVLIKTSDTNLFDFNASNQIVKCIAIKFKNPSNEYKLLGFDADIYDIVFLNKSYSTILKLEKQVIIDDVGIILNPESNILLAIPRQLNINKKDIESLYVYYNNKTLEWPKLLNNKFKFKIPQEYNNNYKTEALSKLNIIEVSFGEFIDHSNEIPLFICVNNILFPNKLNIENKLKKEMTQYAVIYKSYLSGFLFGLSIFDMNPNNSTPMEIYSIKEQKL